MIYFTGISTRHLSAWDIPDDTPRYSSVDDCFHQFLAMHVKMLRLCHESTDPYYLRYLACVKHFDCRVRLSYREFRNVVATLVELYRQYFKDTGNRRRQGTLDNIGKFERLIYLYSNKTFPLHSAAD
ncbi:MAG: hypothetical protein JXQ83_15085 [Candidatus Glassbacteria bacterium]|nr:hypothetical protein [Candidatus Glassbacteria bacterium]